MDGMIWLNMAPHSPDMNLIENVLSISKAGFRKVMRHPNDRPYSCEEVIAIAHQLWEKLLCEPICR
jgi:hypothetical protein